MNETFWRVVSKHESDNGLTVELQRVSWMADNPEHPIDAPLVPVEPGSPGSFWTFEEDGIVVDRALFGDCADPCIGDQYRMQVSLMQVPVLGEYESVPA